MKFNKLIPEFDVLNIDETVSFYKMLGFKIEYERKDEKFVFMSLGEDVQFMFQELNKGNNNWSVGELKSPFGRGINFSIELKENDLNNVYNLLLSNNYKIMVPMEENWYEKDGVLLGNKEFLIQDPDGYLLRLNCDIGEKDLC